MTENIKDYMLQVISAEKETAYMKQLANTDSLTGVRNKFAYDERVENLNEKISKDRIDNFGILMMDLNFLKKIKSVHSTDFIF